MLIGFRITSEPNYITAGEFLQTYCMIPSFETVEGLLLKWETSNIYTIASFTEVQLAAAPFSADPIYRTPNITCINNTDHRVELPYVENGQVKKLSLEATEYTDITMDIYAQIKQFMGLYVRTIPEIPAGTFGDFTKNDFSPIDFFAV